MTTTRVLAVIHGPAFGGAHNQIQLLHEPLLRRGIEVAVVLPSEAAEAAARLRDGGVDTITVPLGRLRATADPRLQSRFAAGLRGDIRRLRGLIRARGADVVQVHGATNPQGALAARLERRPAVVWQLFDTRAPMSLRRLAAPLVRTADAVTVWGRGLIDAHPGIERLGERVVTVFPPVDSARFTPDPARRRAARDAMGVPGDAPLVGTVGVLNPQKGHEYLIAAAAELARELPELRVRLLGGSSPAHVDYERGLREQATRLGLGDDGRLRFEDPTTRVAELLPGFDVFVLSSVPRSEGMPTAILEAMACGIPVVATRVGAVDELVEDGVTGILVEPEDPAAIATATRRLLADEGTRASLGVAARARAEERFGLERLADLHAKAYEIAAHQRDRRLARFSAEGPSTEEREREFFDATADRLDPATLPPREYAPFDSQFEDAILERAGELEGKRVLDLGCGSGDLTLRMLDRGASVVGLDVSPSLIEVARRRVELFRPGAPAEFVVATAEDAGLESEAFDLVVGKWVLHHLDLERATPELRRLLRVGGRGVFVETSGLNPALRFARRHLAGRAGIARYGTVDERPISSADLRLLGSVFARCEADFPNFVLFFLLDRHLLKWRYPALGRICRRADDAVASSLPSLGRLSYYLRITVER